MIALGIGLLALQAGWLWLFVGEKSPVKELAESYCGLSIAVYLIGGTALCFAGLAGMP